MADEINIVSIKAAGDLKNERLVLRVTSDMDIGEYLIAACPRVLSGEPGAIKGEIRFVHWCEDKSVAAGELVVVYTKEGVNKEKPSKSGSKTHFFYWDLPQPIWQRDELVPVVMHIDEWDSFDLTVDDSDDSE